MSTESSASVVLPPSRTIVHWTEEELAQLKPWVEDRNQKVDDIARRFSDVHPHRAYEAVRQKVYKMRRQLDGVAEPIRRSSLPPSGTTTSMLPPPAGFPPPAPIPKVGGERKSTLRPSANKTVSSMPPGATEPRMTVELPNGAKVWGTLDQIAALLKRL